MIKHREEKELYALHRGFSLKWDFITELPVGVERVRLNYGFFEKGDALFTYRCTAEQRSDLVYRSTANHYLTNSEKNIKRCLLLQSEVIKNIKLSVGSIMYIDLWVWES